ncbi:MAG TPA: hypothetical protein VFT74_03545, partial [Isosphaeraceae bacterium]|nr:hypothetical protein [Isosphaeraceae bacterium]
MSKMEELSGETPEPNPRVRGTLGRVWTLIGPFAGLVVIAVLFATLPASSERFLTWDNWRTI